MHRQRDVDIVELAGASVAQQHFGVAYQRHVAQRQPAYMAVVIHAGHAQAHPGSQVQSLGQALRGGAGPDKCQNAHIDAPQTVLPDAAAQVPSDDGHHARHHASPDA